MVLYVPMLVRPDVLNNELLCLACDMTSSLCTEVLAEEQSIDVVQTNALATVPLCRAASAECHWTRLAYSDYPADSTA
jgi:hypothetical protein